jgi:branched-subunit amino acid aminotransferase/4-amino-4-deoxychorismate lyase
MLQETVKNACEEDQVTREIYLNGRIMSFEEASISPDDRALHFSEGVYEVIRAHGGSPLEMGRHMRRLVVSAEYLGIDLLSTADEIAAQSRV